MYYWTLDMNFLAISLLAGLFILFYKKNPLYLRLFTLFLLYTFLNEIAAGYLVEHNKQTLELYNVYVVIQFVFYTYLLSSFILDTRIKKVVKFIQPVYVVLSILNLFFFQKWVVYNSITYSIGSLIIVALSIFYFYELFKQKKVVYLTREPSFWISTGLLFFFTCSFPLIATVNLLSDLKEGTLYTLQNILTLVNVMLYSIFTISFLCQIKVPKPTSSL
jgi:hypothetical protein